MKGVTAGIILVLLGVYFIDNYRHARHAPGILIPDDPYENLIGRGAPWEENGNRFTPLEIFV